jgi:hypothetical protein
MLAATVAQGPANHRETQKTTFAPGQSTPSEPRLNPENKVTFNTTFELRRKKAQKTQKAQKQILLEQ